MKIKVILIGLILIAFLFCLVNHSQARRDPWWENRYPGEHPWQHDDSPGFQDDPNHVSSHVMILPVCLPTKVILLIQAPRYSTGSGEKTAKIIDCQRDKQHFHGKR